MGFHFQAKSFLHPQPVASGEGRGGVDENEKNNVSHLRPSLLSSTFRPAFAVVVVAVSLPERDERKAYKRVGGMIHSADMGRGILGVIDVTNIMNYEDDKTYVLNNKQGFEDCEAYAKLEEWLSHKCDVYWDTRYDDLVLVKDNAKYEPDYEWVQCNKCLKWRRLDSNFESKSLPDSWFCNMEPYNGLCSMPEEKIERGVVTVSQKRIHQPQELGLIPIVLFWFYRTLSHMGTARRAPYPTAEVLEFSTNAARDNKTRRKSVVTAEVLEFSTNAARDNKTRRKSLLTSLNESISGLHSVYRVGLELSS
ncbi:hypothetical protein EJ110_NYTH54961 [Nymphaea thermarum]|nr:hypothetical protein EJ110_NYTH54961 [Nymphaea thermarum]